MDSRQAHPVTLKLGTTTTDWAFQIATALLFLLVGKKPLTPRARRFTPWPAPISAGSPATPHDSKPACSQTNRALIGLRRIHGTAGSLGAGSRATPNPAFPRRKHVSGRPGQAVRGSPSQSAFLVPLESNTRLPVFPLIDFPGSSRHGSFPLLWHSRVKNVQAPVIALRLSTSFETRCSCAAPPWDPNRVPWRLPEMTARFRSFPRMTSSS